MVSTECASDGGTMLDRNLRICDLLTSHDREPAMRAPLHMPPAILTRAAHARRALRGPSAIHTTRG